MTQQKHFEIKNIRQKEQLQFFGTIIENSMNEIFIFDAENLRFTYVNRAALNNIGYTLEEMRGMTPVDIKPEYTMKSFLLCIKPLIDGSKNELVFETIHQRKDTSLYNVEIRLQIMNTEENRQYVVIAHDISERKKSQIALQESEEKFRNIAENTLMGIFIYQDHFVYVNEAFRIMSGYSEKELYNMKPWELIQEPYQEAFKKTITSRLKGEKFPKDYNDIKFLSKNNQIKTVRVMTQTIRYKYRYAGVGTVIDVTDIKETKEQLQLLAQAVEQTDELVRISDKNGIITYVNDALVAHTGYRKIELIGKKISLFKSGQHDQLFYKELWDTILSGQTFKGTFINRKKDRQIYYEEEIITPIFDTDNNIKHFLATSQDITQRVHMEEKLQRLATIDSLTEIYNRHHINEEITTEISRAERYRDSFALAMIDVDYFKSINDTFGHDIGDNVLRELTQVISQHIRESDRFGRWGGEEFIIILPQLKHKPLLSLAEKLRKAIDTHAFKDGIHVSISIGLTLFKGGETKQELVKRVDKALYSAKNSGRNTVYYQ